jgi:DNA-binding NarL/FixJ family response regulator
MARSPLARTGRPAPRSSSACSAEIVAACGRGADTRGLARELFVSENTIQDHFKSIFAKTGTRTRGELLAIARGR